VKDKKQLGDSRVFGDFIIWRQLLDHARTSKVPIIFVTDDRKEDWVWREKGRTLGPHPSLRREFLDAVGESMYIYETARFMQLGAQKLLGRDVRTAVTAELSRYDELDSARIAAQRRQEAKVKAAAAEARRAIERNWLESANSGSAAGVYDAATWSALRESLRKYLANLNIEGGGYEAVGKAWLNARLLDAELDQPPLPLVDASLPGDTETSSTN
jgi:hypothetical protein